MDYAKYMKILYAIFQLMITLIFVILRDMGRMLPAWPYTQAKITSFPALKITLFVFGMLGVKTAAVSSILMVPISRPGILPEMYLPLRHLPHKPSFSMTSAISTKNPSLLLISCLTTRMNYCRVLIADGANSNFPIMGNLCYSVRLERAICYWMLLMEV